jgi:Asp-tRNA(Asn)/Glu-tRNA(Gln) amidotransferase A subunit family amidase
VCSISGNGIWTSFGLYENYVKLFFYIGLKNRYTMAWNICGYPAVAVGDVCKGVKEFEGLPVGVQLIATPYNDSIALAAAKFVQKQIREIKKL